MYKLNFLNLGVRQNCVKVTQYGLIHERRMQMTGRKKEKERRGRSRQTSRESTENGRI